MSWKLQNFQIFLIAVSKKASGATKQDNVTALILKIGHLWQINRIFLYKTDF